MQSLPAQFTTTVPKELVHRAAVAEVLLTRWLRHDASHFSASAQWPRGHSFFKSPDGVHYDSMLVAETIRQVSTLIAHAEFDVPLTSHSLMGDLDYTADLDLLKVGGTPADLELSVTCTEIRRTGGQVSKIRFDVVFFRDGRQAASGSAVAAFIRPEVYRRVRGDRLSTTRAELPLLTPVAPRLVGRYSGDDVVLAPSGDQQRWLLRADTRHPILFDHPGDHIPGMVLLEAARQAARVLVPAGASVSSTVNIFERYVEFDAPCWIEAREEPSGDLGTRQVSVRAEQYGRTAFTNTITVPVSTEPAAAPLPVPTPLPIPAPRAADRPVAARPAAALLANGATARQLANA
ncbi:ScbA/BarX family gamma-butyrolactone biosynthesis protein [Kitasatospora sp. MAP5-34]|uniref:ScbA/BarX family gamma-butyrolactone biosynthesis protein n=1 Tax=Kitasatospora sp. MAP5-34 TaxID=3035102 RepID=UPI002476F550|nr:ScbA/BarX family gamma-butyrolactone biosynthesis protein [Kitasatospora sp. MAP5-34]MDH6576300.1 hypothetical protein [Kitasatospora sp. MAP5-34]